MKSYPKQFSSFPYYEHLGIAHMFDTMHIEKNISGKLWILLELNREKEKIVEFCKDIQEGNRAMKDVIKLHSNGVQINIKSLPWILTKQQSNFVKELMKN